ncbi:MAG: transposase [Caldilineaceae bacterium SB0670_bin_27]|uniref:Transposase n=1 Tax=Caldilineaceae bacterium SB0664_bin_27 TaxID=2605260 RepID=A0A6B0YU64_9CHLR|nr:transposase [Caldilineaceae bacterium SB0664_bin_27]MYJ77039.1 transposase [Caldilineaceae bacterium SB0670_bin_27]
MPDAHICYPSWTTGSVSLAPIAGLRAGVQWRTLPGSWSAGSTVWNRRRRTSDSQALHAGVCHLVTSRSPSEANTAAFRFYPCHLAVSITNTKRKDNVPTM